MLKFKPILNNKALLFSSSNNNKPTILKTIIKWQRHDNPNTLTQSHMSINNSHRRKDRQFQRQRTLFRGLIGFCRTKVPWLSNKCSNSRQRHSEQAEHNQSHRQEVGCTLIPHQVWILRPILKCNTTRSHHHTSAQQSKLWANHLKAMLKQIHFPSSVAKQSLICARPYTKGQKDTRLVKPNTPI